MPVTGFNMISANRRMMILLWMAMICCYGISAQSKSKKQSKKPLIVFVTGDHEYSSEATMPAIAAELEKNYGFRTKVLKAYPDHNAEENIPGLEALKDADVAVFFFVGADYLLNRFR
jgi:dienelactone hydrolase